MTTLQAGPPDAALAERLERAYYALTAQTERHFRRDEPGWFLTGVAGLDASTMNRAVVTDATPVDVERVTDDASAYFAQRECSWSVVLSSFRDHRGWHAELIARGYSPSSLLDVLVRAPDAPLPPAPDVQIREARADEVGHFTDIMVEVFRMPRRFYPALLDMTDAWRREGARLYFALDDEGAPAATALLAKDDGVAGIYNVATKREARRRGFASALMARMLADARDCDVVTLQVAPDGFVEPFYLRMGFAPAYRWRFYTPRSRW